MLTSSGSRPVVFFLSVVVAYCLQARNNARLIPDGTIQSAHFIKTPLYVQIQGYFDGTKVSMPCATRAARPSG